MVYPNWEQIIFLNKDTLRLMYWKYHKNIKAIARATGNDYSTIRERLEEYKIKTK